MGRGRGIPEGGGHGSDLGQWHHLGQATAPVRTCDVRDSHRLPGLHEGWCLAALAWLSKHSVPTEAEHSQPIQATVGVKPLTPGPLPARRQVSQGPG